MRFHVITHLCYIYQHLQRGAKWFRYRVSNLHSLGFNWHQVYAISCNYTYMLHIHTYTFTRLNLKQCILLMEEILHQSILRNSHFHRVLYILSGAGFFPSTVSIHLYVWCMYIKRFYIHSGISLISLTIPLCAFSHVQGSQNL